MRTALLFMLLIAAASFAQGTQCFSNAGCSPGDTCQNNICVTHVTTTVTTTGSCISNATDVISGDQGDNIAAVIAFIIVLIAIAYAAGTSLGNANYIVFAKDEAYHLGFSVVMLICFSGILVFTCTLMDFFYQSTFTHMNTLLSAQGTTGCYQPGKSITALSTCYITAIKSDATQLTKTYINQYIGQLMDSTFSWSIQYPLVDAYTLTAGAYRRVVSNEYDMILNTFLIPALMSISMQKLMLEFISENAVRWILPIAFLLRVFPPTRQMGNIFIALVIGIYVVVPFMYVFNLSMYDITLNNCNDFKNAVCDGPMDNYACDTPAGVTAACTNTSGFWYVARLIPQAFFLPNLTIVVLVTFLSGVHKALRVVG
jgi:hypothetical protein